MLRRAHERHAFGGRERAVVRPLLLVRRRALDPRLEKVSRALTRRARFAGFARTFRAHSSRRYPFISKPTGEYGELWYGSSPEANYFRRETRLFNCRYAYASLEASEVKVRGRGKPVFQLAGAVYYNVAQTFVPPSQYSPSYAQLYTMDAEDGFQLRLKQILSGDAPSPRPRWERAARPVF